MTGSNNLKTDNILSGNQRSESLKLLKENKQLDMEKENL